MTDTVETKFYRLADGRLGKIDIHLDLDPLNPRETDTNGSIILGWSTDVVTPDGYENIPDVLSDAISQWSDSRSIDAARIIRYARIFHSDSILYIAALERGSDGWSRYSASTRLPDRFSGLVIVTRESYAAVHGDDGPMAEIIDDMVAVEIEEYNAWASGDAYGYIVTVDDDQVDSCWGFIGHRISYEAMMAQARFNLGDGAEEIDEDTYLAGPVIDIDLDKERQFNQATTFLPMDPADPDTLPCVEIAGVQVYVYVKDGKLVVNQHHDNADPYFRPSPVHKAEPGSRPYNCRSCGQVIRSVPGGNGPTWVHDATGTVAAPLTRHWPNG